MKPFKKIIDHEDDIFDDQSFIEKSQGFSLRIKHFPVNDELKVLLQEFDQSIEALSYVCSKEIRLQTPGTFERTIARNKLDKVFNKIKRFIDDEISPTKKVEGK